MATANHTPEDTFVVIAAFNEATVIARVVGELVAAGWRVVVVDDGSSDATAERAHGAVVLRHVLNRGQGAALQTGIDYALAHGARAVVTFDADGQHRVEDIAQLLAALDGGADIALGSRFLGGTSGASRGRRRLLATAVWVSNAISGLRLSDAHCGLRAFRADAASALRLSQDRMAHASELLANIRRHRLRVTEVPVQVSYTEYSRAKGQTGFQAVRILFDYFFRAC